MCASRAWRHCSPKVGTRFPSEAHMGHNRRSLSGYMYSIRKTVVCSCGGSHATLVGLTSMCDFQADVVKGCWAGSQGWRAEGQPLDILCQNESYCLWSSVVVTSDKTAKKVTSHQGLPRRRQKRRPFLLKKFGASRREIQTIKFEIWCVATDRNELRLKMCRFSFSIMCKYNFFDMMLPKAAKR